jgi:YkoY family integral membrane protein
MIIGLPGLLPCVDPTLCLDTRRVKVRSLYWLDVFSLPFLQSVQPSDFLTVGVLVALEGLLSADNAMVLAVLVLGLPRQDQRKALRYGILGAFAFRSIATLLAVYLISLAWVKLAGAAYLLYLAGQHFLSHADAEHRRTPARAAPMLGLSAFWATVVKVELTDIVFAIDSILVAVAMSSKIWVILAGGILGIVMMRMVIGRLLAIVQRYPPLVDGAFVIIAWVGIKLVLEYLHTEAYIPFEIPRWLSLGLIVAIFAAALWYARRVERTTFSRDEQRASELLNDQQR